MAALAVSRVAALDYMDMIFCTAFAAAGRGRRGREAKIAASAASPSGRADSRRWWLRLHCLGVRKHVHNASRPSPPCPLNPSPPLLPFRTAPVAANLSLQCDMQQVHIERRLA